MSALNQMAELDAGALPGKTQDSLTTGSGVGARSTGVGLRKRVFRASVWSVGGHCVSQLIRLGGNLALTRLLFPEAFGLMAMVQVVWRALEMFSDVGVVGSVIRDKRGDDPAFLSTAWTIRVVRGVALWLCGTLLAWPVSVLYGEPALKVMIPVAGLGAVFIGLSSTATLTLQRHVQLRPLVILDVLCGVSGLVVTIVLAIALQSVWALIYGGLFRAAARCVLSYLLLPGPRSWFGWDPAAAREIYKFGRWIFVSTAATFLLQQGDVAALGAMISAKLLGVYAIAALLSRSVLQILLKLNGQVLFPAYARLTNDRPEQLRSRVFQARATLFAVLLPILCVLVIWGREIVSLLYDSRYKEAGWMLQILAAGAIGSVISATIGSVLLAAGDSFRFMLLQLTRGALLISGITIGSLVAGLPGVVVGVAASKFADYPMLAWAIRRYGVWMPGLDAAAVLGSAGVIALGIWLT